MMDYPQFCFGSSTPASPYQIALQHPSPKSRADEFFTESKASIAIDPSLASSQPQPPSSPSWGHQKYPGSPQDTAFFDPRLLQPRHQQQQQPGVGSDLQVDSHLAPGQSRHDSPYSTLEFNSSCGSLLLSPPSESEHYYDSGPSTPPCIETSTMPAPSSSKQQALGQWPVTTTFSGFASTPAYGYPFEMATVGDVVFGDVSNGMSFSEFNPPQPGFILSSNVPSTYDMNANQVSTQPGFINGPILAPANPSFQARGATRQAYQSNMLVQDEVDSEAESHDEMVKSEDDDDFLPIKSARQQYRRASSTSSKRKQSPTASSRKPSTSRTEETQSLAKRPRLAETSQRHSQQPLLAMANASHASSASAPSLDNIGMNIDVQAAGHLSCHQCKDDSFKDLTSLQLHVKKQHTRPFVCVFSFAGCPCTFASKNEWKRHVKSQHLLLHYWLCTVGTCANTVNTGLAPAIPAQPSRSHRSSVASAAGLPRPGSLRGRNSSALSAGGAGAGTGVRFGPPLPNGAIFNRKDLYTQHVRRMHMPVALKKQQQSSSSSSSEGGKKAKTSTKDQAEWEQEVKRLQAGAQKNRCNLPQRMTCPAVGCREVFEGADTWDVRMEHLGQHLEAAANGNEPPVPMAGGDADPSLVEWASHEDVAIILRCPAETPGEFRWELNNPLKPTDAPARAAAAGTMAVRSQSVVVAVGGEEDADGEVCED